MPAIVIKNLRLYLNRFLTLTFCMKDSLDQMGGILSRSTLFPGFGALGRMSDAAAAPNVVWQAAAAAPAVASTANPTEYAMTAGEKMNFMGGSRYSSPHS